MKILLTADWHFDRNNRLEDFVAATDYMVDYALNHEIKHFFILGDMYRDWTPTSVERTAFHQVLAKLVLGDVHVHLLLGNHDVNDKQPEYLQHALSEFVDIGSSQIHLYHKGPEIIRIAEKRILMLPHLSRAYLQGLKKPATYAEEFLRAIATPGADLILTHALFFDAIDGPYNPEDVRGLSFKDMAPALKCPMIMGDIHSGKVLQEDPFVAYTSSPERITFNEIRDQKGCIIYDLETKQHEFLPSPARKFFQLTVDLAQRSFWFTSPALKESKVAPLPAGDMTDIMVSILSAAGSEISNAVVKLVVSGPKQETIRINRHAVITHLKEHNPYKIAKVSFVVTDDTVVRDSTFTGHLTPQDAFDKWYGKQNYESKEMAAAVRQLGMEMLNEVA